ncbi:MAG: two-component sensor histidine kinase, partial [Rhodoblastus sp.]
MQKRGSQFARRWARLRLAATFAASPAVFPSGVRAQTFGSLAHFDGANGLIGLSLGAGLVVFAAGASLLLLAGRKNWSRREAELLAETERSRQAAERARAFLAAETQFVVVWGGESGEPDIEGDVTL